MHWVLSCTRAVHGLHSGKFRCDACGGRIVFINFMSVRRIGCAGKSRQEHDCGQKWDCVQSECARWQVKRKKKLTDRTKILRNCRNRTLPLPKIYRTTEISHRNSPKPKLCTFRTAAYNLPGPQASRNPCFRLIHGLLLRSGHPCTGPPHTMGSPSTEPH